MNYELAFGRGGVVDKRCENVRGAPRYLVELKVTVFNQWGETCCPAEVTLELLT